MSNFNNVLDKISLYLENSNFNKSKPIKNTFIQIKVIKKQQTKINKC
jgi:hypothetical protein